MKLDELSEEEFIDKYYDLFPIGVKSGGYPVRNGRSNVAKKLKSFMEQHKEFNRAVILVATKNYLDERKRQGYAYCKLASYFISKDNISMLEGYCEAVVRGLKDINEESSNKHQLGTTDF